MNLSTAQGIYLGATGIQSVYLGSTLIWPLHDYSQDYFTIVSLENNNAIRWRASDSTYLKTISISTDGGNTWTSYTSSTGSGTLLATLNTDDELLIKGNNASYATSGPLSNAFIATKKYNLQGNIMSLIYEDNYIGQTILTDPLTFYMLFGGGPYLVNAQNLILPATTLTSSCYNSMFYGCTALITAPALPATTLAAECYNSMFNSCTALITAPALPATTLAPSCYLSMFKKCSALTAAPALPATTLTDECYWSMFESCTALTTAPELPATTLAEGCYWSMFSKCNQLVTPPQLPATTLAPWCYNNMFYWCTSLTTAPELPATTLADHCYQTMFNTCMSLQYIKCLATDISATDCLTNWVTNVGGSGTFVKDANTTWPTGVSGIPSGWTVQNA